MRIALTGYRSQSDADPHVESGPSTTVRLITGALERLGHEVRTVDVSAAVSSTISALERFRPDLVFNTGEGRRGRLREAFFSALFDELRMPYTGAGPCSLARSWDRHLTKLVVAEHGIRTPAAQYVTDVAQLRPDDLSYPVIVKPNSPGRGRGMFANSIADDRDALTTSVSDVLRHHPDGILAEEFIAGADVTVPCLEAAAGGHGGVLPPVGYRSGDDASAAGRTLHDDALKRGASMSLRAVVPAALAPDQTQTIRQMTQRVVRLLGIRDLGCVDYRVSVDGDLFFLQAEARPSLEPGAALYAAATLAGLDSMERVLDAIIISAARRWGIRDRAATSRGGRGGLRVGFTYNEKRLRPDIAGHHDSEAEFDSPEVLQAIRDALAEQGHAIVDLEATVELPAQLACAEVDVVFNIAEGAEGRGRELHVPALLEMLQIPYSGSDSVAMALSLDKSVGKHIVAGAGVRTPAHVVLHDWRGPVPPALLESPVVVKPLAEGTSKGVMGHSVVCGENAVREAACAVIAKYKQPALVETYLPGREFTVGLLGYPRPRVLPPMEILFLDSTIQNPVYSFDTKQRPNETIGYRVPAALADEDRQALDAAALLAFDALGCRDMARIDFRMDAQGRLNFLECNPLPGLAPGWSDYVLIANAAGVSYGGLIAEILSGAIRRGVNRSAAP